MSSDSSSVTNGGWDRLLALSDSELRGANEETIDQLYVFLLTNKLSANSELAHESTRLTKLVTNLQTILRFKHAEFQEQITEYEEERGVSVGGVNERLEQEKNRLQQLVIEQERKIAEFEDNSVGGGASREVLVLRREIDDLRRELTETKRVLEMERLESQRLSRELTAGTSEAQRLQAEVSLKKDEIMEYHLHLERQKDNKKLGLVEEELRERLRVQGREMAEQLDKMEVLLKEKSSVEQEMTNMGNQLTLYEEEKVNRLAEIQKYQSSLVEATRANTELERKAQRLQSELAHVQDQLTIQTNTNQKLCDRLNEETERAKSKLSSSSNELTQARDKITQLEAQLHQYLTDTRKGSIIKLNKELSEKERDIQQLQDDLYQASQDIDSLSQQLKDTIKQSDPGQINPVLHKEINDLKVHCTQLEKLLNNEQQRRQQSEVEKEECDILVAELRLKIDRYESGQAGLKEAINEIKQRKEELSRKDSELSALIHKANKLQKDCDILYELNEGLRERLGLAPDQNPDLTEVRDRRQGEMNQLKERNHSLTKYVERLEEEKLSLRKKIIDQATTNIATNITTNTATAVRSGSSVHSSSPDHHVTLVADLRSQISQLNLSLNTERQRKEACQREIARLSKEVTTVSNVSLTNTELKTTIKEEHESDLKKENDDLQIQLTNLNQQYQLLVDTLSQKDNEILSLKTGYHTPTHLMTPTHHLATPTHVLTPTHLHVPTPTHLITPSLYSKDKGEGLSLPTDVSSLTNEQLMMILNELKEREMTLNECQLQLEEYKKKLNTITYQQGLLYKEYHDMKDKWSQEKEQFMKEKEDHITAQQNNQIKLDELKSLQDVLSSSNDSDKLKQTLGDYSRSITLLRVNERTLTRANTLLAANNSVLRKEVDRLRANISNMENSFNEEMNYLRRYKESASYKLINLQQSLSQMVPLTQLHQANTQYTHLVSQCHALFQQRVATSSSSEDSGERIRVLSEKLVQSEVKENDLKLSIANNGECSKCVQLREQIDSLELSRTKLHQEISQLKDTLQVTGGELVNDQKRREVKEKELNLLRQQNIELASQSDHKTLIGQLQQQISTLQLAETHSQSQLHKLKSKLHSVEGQLLRADQLCVEREEQSLRDKSVYIDRIQRLNALLQVYHRQYIGATLCPDQVKFCQLLSQVERNKNKTQQLCDQTEQEKENIQMKVQELELERANLKELMATLKEDKVDKLTELHSKLGELRLKELHHQKTITKLQTDFKHCQERVTDSEGTISLLEEKVVRTTKEYEELLLSLDSDRVVTKRTVDNNNENIVKCSHSPLITQLQTDIKSLQGQCNALDSSLRKSEVQLIDKDKIINELQLQISSLETKRESDRREREVNTSKTLQITNETIEQLKSQLSQKEGQVEKYQRLLQESRQEFQLSIENYKEEMLLMERKLQTKSNALSRLQDSLSTNSQQPVPFSSSSSHFDHSRLANYERRTEELLESNKELSRQVEYEKKEREIEKTKLLQKEEELRKEMSQLKHKHRIEIKELQATLSSKTDQVNELEQELEILNSELSTALETNKKVVPSRGVRDLVERLRNQLASKEHELKVLSESLKQVRADLVDTAHKTLQSHTRQESSEMNVHKIVMERVRAVEEREEDKMKEMKRQIKQLENELEDMRKRWKDKCNECDELQIDYQRKEKGYNERGSLLEKQENDNRHLKRLLNEAKNKEQTLNKEIKQLKERVSSSDQELVRVKGDRDTLQDTVEAQRQELQQELHRASQERASRMKATPIYQLDTKHTSLEVARWEEGKKWQRKVEVLRQKVSEKTKELETLQKYVTSLKDKLSRSEREKDILSERLKTAERTKPVIEQSITKQEIEKMFQIKSDNFELQNKVTVLEQELERAKGNSQLDELRAEIKSLTDINSALKEERKRSGVASGSFGESKLREELLQSKKAYTQLQFQYQQASLELPRLKSRVNDLEQYVEVLKNVSGNSRPSGEAKPGSYTAEEVDKVVSAMKKVIERLQGENESLKVKVKRKAKGEEEGILELENKRLKLELDKVQKSLAVLGGGRGEKSESPLAGVINENEKLRNELRKEVEKGEKLHVSVSKLKSDKTKLENDLAKFSDPQKLIVKERDDLRRENTKLKAELESFDPQFFEEIEDLKYNYQISIQKNIEYEEHLRHYSRQYGFQLPSVIENDTE